jgi:ABC-type multidrug transport system fused ATPase/permease subunit
VNKRANIASIFFEFVRDYRRYFSLLFLFLFIEGVLATLSVVTLVPFADFMLDPSLSNPSRITKFIINVITGVGGTPSFWVFGTIFIVTNLFKGGLDILIRYAILRIKYAVMRGLISDTLGSIFRSRWNFFSNSGQGAVLNTLNRELGIIGDTLGALATLLAQTLQLCIYLVVPLLLNVQITLTALFLAACFGVPFMFMSRKSYRLGRLNTETASAALGTLNEILNAARLILGFGRQKEAESRYLEAYDKHAKVTLKSQVLSMAVPKLFQPLALLALVVSLGLAMQRQLAISELAAVMWSLLAALPIFSALLQGNVSLSSFLPSYEQLVVLRSKAAASEEVQGKISFNKLKEGIELQCVTFTYLGREQTLTSLNLLIRKGQVTALIGESGSGKSTITDLVLGLQTPEKGRVLIDGVPFECWHQNSFRNKVGYVPQDPFLFHCSIRDNLLWSQEHSTDEDLWKALDLANGENFVKQLPQGLDTIVGDRGTRLSGGQRQRIALARALLRRPELLILDEATSALDSESERLIQEAIERVAQTTTILLVAHRLSSIVKADEIYVLKEGKIVEQGSFATLSVASGGVLHGMLQLQFPLSQVPLDTSLETVTRSDGFRTGDEV